MSELKDRLNQRHSDKIVRLARSLSEAGQTGEVMDDVEENTEARKSSYEVDPEKESAFLRLFNLPAKMAVHRGTFNQTTPDDRSNEETRSSFSSSEEALTQCKGVIAMIPVHPTNPCASYNDSVANAIRLGLNPYLIVLESKRSLISF